MRRAAKRFARADQGNIAMIFAITLVPLLAMVGAAVDYTRASAARSAIQGALDTAALMVSRDAAANPTLSGGAIQALATKYFNALYHNADAAGVTVTATYSPAGGGAQASITMEGSGTVPTDFMKLVGINQVAVGADSKTAWGNTRMRVAMVLDNTGSMAQNQKMPALISAAQDMVDSLSVFSKTSGDVYISVIPFSKDVNLGSSNANANWINWTDWLAEPTILTQNGYPSGWDTTVAGSTCPFTNKSHGFTCMDRPATVSGAKSATSIPSTGTYSGYICPSVDSGNKLSYKNGHYYNGCYTTKTTTVASGSNASCGSTTHCTCSGSGSKKVCTQVLHQWRGDGTVTTAAAAPKYNAAVSAGGWNGCIEDRDQDNDISNVAPSPGDTSTPSTLFYAEQSSNCPPGTVTPMSDQWSTIKNQIGAMTPSGSTNQAIGLAWGWQSLSTTNGPIQAPAKASNYVYKDYIVLLSDGLNTQNRFGGDGSTTDTDIDARQEILCKNVKDPTLNGGDQITVFTIQVNINNKDPTSKVLQDCASGANNFQMITTADQTATAFQNILTQITQLRLAQ
jgi:Flp pilus assembly protein TadG